MNTKSNFLCALALLLCSCEADRAQSQQRLQELISENSKDKARIDTLTKQLDSMSTSTKGISEKLEKLMTQNDQMLAKLTAQNEQMLAKLATPPPTAAPIAIQGAPVPVNNDSQGGAKDSRDSTRPQRIRIGDPSPSQASSLPSSGGASGGSAQKDISPSAPSTSGNSRVIPESQGGPRMIEKDGRKVFRLEP